MKNNVWDEKELKTDGFSIMHLKICNEIIDNGEELKEKKKKKLNKKILNNKVKMLIP